MRRDRTLFLRSPSPLPIQVSTFLLTFTRTSRHTNPAHSTCYVAMAVAQRDQKEEREKKTERWCYTVSSNDEGGPRRPWLGGAGPGRAEQGRAKQCRAEQSTESERGRESKPVEQRIQARGSTAHKLIPISTPYQKTTHTNNLACLPACLPLLRHQHLHPHPQTQVHPIRTQQSYLPASQTAQQHGTARHEPEATY
jgi:hypothetical protein